MKKDFYPDRTVCSLQLELKYNYKKLNKMLNSEEGCLTEDLNSLITEMSQISKSIHYKATRMEKRLLKYRKAIENLGFIRK